MDRLIAISAFLLIPWSLEAAKFHVQEGGVDDPSRDGKTWETAWASLAFACEQVPEDGGEHTIFLRAGTYVATRTAHPKSSTTITGEGAGGKKGTYLVASKDWPLSDEFKGDAPPEEEHLISFKKQSTIRIQNLSLLSDPEHRITGGIYATASKGLVFEGLRLRDFRWNGVFLNVCQEVDLG
ncbi:MAG: hypothetical protein AAGJ31_02770, partial [Verrucomicrobiota bacterium]